MSTDESGVSKATVDPWTPSVSVSAESLVPSTIYVLPTRTITEEGRPIVVFEDSVRYLPKYSRAAGIEAQFAPIDGEERRFLTEYSHDPNDWQLALTFIGFLNDWVILTVNTWLTDRCQMTGMSRSEALEHEMELDIAEWKPATGEFSGVRIRGKGSDVLEAVRELRSLGE